MKRIVYTLSLCLGIICFSCDGKQCQHKETFQKLSDSKEVTSSSKKIEVTRKPDTIIDGRHIYNFGKDNVKAKEMSFEEIIDEFDSGVKSANNCEELIKSCARFDSRIKKLGKTNSNFSLIEVEKRDDVKAIRKLSEEKSLKMCQTKIMK